VGLPFLAGLLVPEVRPFLAGRGRLECLAAHNLLSDHEGLAAPEGLAFL